MYDFVSGGIISVVFFLIFWCYFNVKVIFVVDKQVIFKMEVNRYCLCNYLVFEIFICFQLGIIFFKKFLLVDQ